MTRVAVLLSIGRHPASGRPRRAPLDARALELALRLPEAEILALHAGDPASPALREYLGMGLPEITALRLPEGADPVPALVARLRAFGPDLILTGAQAEAGEDSGMVPYLLAEALGAAVAPNVVEIALGAGPASLEALMALPRGRRRKALLPLPAALAVGPAAPAPRQPSFARARRGRVLAEEAPLAGEAAAGPDAFLAGAAFQPYRRRAAAAAALRGSARERLKAATESRAGEGRLLVRPAPEEAAAALHDYLTAKGALR